MLDLWAYLRSVPATSSEAPANELRFPFSQRPLLALWKGLFFESRRVRRGRVARRHLESRRLPG